LKSLSKYDKKARFQMDIELNGEILEQKFIFFPTKEILEIPSDYGLEYKEFFFPSQDGVRICAWLIELGAYTPLLLFFHGNGGNIGDRSENLALLARRGISSFIIDYQGYGKSEGKPGELACYQDARASYSFLREELKIPKERIFLFGRSLGGAVAVDLAQEIDFPAVILESTFTSFGDLVARFVPSLARSLKNKFNSLEKISQLRSPLLFIHGDMDEIVPYENGRKLFESAPQPKEFYTIAGAGHNDTYLVGGEEYFDKIKKFIFAHFKI